MAKEVILFGKTQLDDYKKIDQLGKGTYGEVNKYVHISTGTIVAIKTFLFDVRKNSILFKYTFRMKKME